MTSEHLTHNFGSITYKRGFLNRFEKLEYVAKRSRLPQTRKRALLLIPLKNSTKFFRRIRILLKV